MVRRRRRRSTFSRARWLVVCLAIVVVGLVLATWYLVRVRGQLQQDQVELGTRITELAARRGAGDDDIRPDDPIRKVDGVFIRSWYLTLPSHEAAAALVGDIETEIKSRGLHLAVVEPDQADLVRLNLDLGIEVYDLHLRVAVRKAVKPVATPRPRPTATPRPSPAPGQRGRLAILLDDAGQQLELISMASGLPEAVAVSVLPFLPSSTSAAAEMHRGGHEVWLHLPMEPAEYPTRNPGPGALLVSMSEGEIRTTVRAALNNVPHVVGVNNHMGSRATTDLRTMT
jgi:hypothetical protein